MNQALSAADVESWRETLGLTGALPPTRLQGEARTRAGHGLAGMQCAAAGGSGNWDAAVYHRRLSLVEVTCALVTPTVLKPNAADADRGGVLVVVTADWPGGLDRMALIATSGQHQFSTDRVTDTVILRIPAESLGVGRSAIASLSGAAVVMSHLATTAACAVRGFAASVLATEVNAASTVAAESALVELLVVTIAEANARRAESLSNTEDVRRRTAELIELHHRDPEFSPTALAAQMHLSRRQFYRHFEECDQGVAEMIAGRRLRAARALLLSNPNASIAWVARASGFGSVGPFRLRFRREFGVGPNEFRDRMTAGDDVAHVG